MLYAVFLYSQIKIREIILAYLAQFDLLWIQRIQLCGWELYQPRVLVGWELYQPRVQVG